MAIFLNTTFLFLNNLKITKQFVTIEFYLYCDTLVHKLNSFHDSGRDGHIRVHVGKMDVVVLVI